MDHFDDTVRRALEKDESESWPEAALDDLSIFDQVRASFHGRRRWMVALNFALLLLFGTLAIVSAIFFLDSPTIAVRTGWALGVVLCVIMVAMLKIWYWMELGKNSILREIKRVELQLAVLTERIGLQRRQP